MREGGETDRQRQKQIQTENQRDKRIEIDIKGDRDRHRETETDTGRQTDKASDRKTVRRRWIFKKRDRQTDRLSG